MSEPSAPKDGDRFLDRQYFVVYERKNGVWVKRFPIREDEWATMLREGGMTGDLLPERGG